MPSFVTDPVKDFQKYHSGINTNEEWDEFNKAVDDNIYKEPSLMYLLLTETDSTFKVNLLQSICSFVMFSPIEKWQGPLESDELTGQYQGFKYDLLTGSGKSKGVKAGGFIPLSQLIAHFVRYFHYLLIYLIKKESEDHVLATLLKLFSVLVEVTPYKKMNDDLLQCCMIPHITNMMSEIVKDEETSISEHIQKNLLLCFSSSSHLLCPLILNDEETKLEGVLKFKESNSNIIKWLMTDLHENMVKKSFEAIETLTSIAKSYPWIFIDYWDQFKDYINIVFSITEVKRTIATLKLLETWISSIETEKGKLTKKHHTLDDESDVEEIKGEAEVDEAVQEKLKYFDILNLDGCTKLLNKYLNFFIKSSDSVDLKATVVNILCILTQQQWEGIFSEKEREKIIDSVLTSKIAKVDCSKFIGH